MESRAWVATRKGLFELRRRSAGWAVERVGFLGEPVSMLLPPRAGGRMLAALNLGHFGVKLHASDDAGVSWHEVAAPAYPPQPAGEPAGGVAWKLVQIWALEAGHAGTLWAGTLPGGLFRSNDRGESWQLVESLWNQPGRAQWFGGGYDVPGIHSICPHPQRAGELLVGISCGGAWVSRDDGTSWQLQADGMRAAYMPPDQAGNPNTQDPHRIVRSPTQPDVLWCQHHNGIWRSADNARSWQEITGAPGSTFGFAVAVHPSQPDTAWFVPGVADQQRVPVGAALQVNRTRDGGRSFEALRAGLPQRDCYDLVYRHGLAVDASGERLLMGSTTGNLWASDDGGERWERLAVDLPPIAAVRFD
ncbi:MAG TPA: exo-alpha-sialidase [Burkholderiaceae bacterium]|nr:exo-alpha-sialidase [Burkholderiaceae bacterium]